MCVFDGDGGILEGGSMFKGVLMVFWGCLFVCVFLGCSSC